MKLPENIQRLIDEFMKLPGIGPKTSERFVFFLLKQPKQSLLSFSAAIQNLANSITNCDVCHCVSQTNPCLICADPKRNGSQVCVIAETHDITNLEKTNQFTGYYHVLNGVIDPLHGITPDKLTIDHLLKKVQQQPEIKEVILALNPDIEGETTMAYLKKILSPFNINITRLAQGLPTGADLEYADPNTLTKAMNNRTKV